MHTRSMATPDAGALFTTATGQTGRDAYVFEATAIANAKRELDARMRTLLEAMRAESPELFACPSDWNPRLGHARAESALSLAEYVALRA